MKNILVPIDFEGAASYLLLGEAYKMAEKFDAKVWLIHVVTPDPEFVGYDVGPQYVRDTRASELKKEHQLIKGYTDELKKKGVEAEGLLIFGSTVEMIQAEAVKLKIDMIIMGHHNHSSFYNALYGSTDLQVMENLNIPLMMIPMDWGK